MDNTTDNCFLLPMMRVEMSLKGQYILQSLIQYIGINFHIWISIQLPGTSSSLIMDILIAPQYGILF